MRSLADVFLGKPSGDWLLPGSLRVTGSAFFGSLFAKTVKISGSHEVSTKSLSSGCLAHVMVQQVGTWSNEGERALNLFRHWGFDRAELVHPTAQSSNQRLL